MVVHDAEELVRGDVPDQHEAGEVAAELEPLAPVLDRLRHVRDIEVHRDHAVAGNGAGDHVQHGPARLAAHFGLRGEGRMDAPAREHLRAPLADVAIGGFDEFDRLPHRIKAARLARREDARRAYTHLCST